MLLSVQQNLLAEAALILGANTESAGKHRVRHLHFCPEKMNSEALRWLHTSLCTGNMVMTGGSLHAHVCSGYAAGDALLVLLHTIHCMTQADAMGLVCAQRPFQQQGQQLVLGEVGYALRAEVLHARLLLTLHRKHSGLA